MSTERAEQIAAALRVRTSACDAAVVAACVAINATNQAAYQAAYDAYDTAWAAYQTTLARIDLEYPT